MDDFHEGWVPATYLDPLYGSEDISVQKLDVGEGKCPHSDVDHSYIVVRGP